MRFDVTLPRLTLPVLRCPVLRADTLGRARIYKSETCFGKGSWNNLGAWSNDQPWTN